MNDDVILGRLLGRREAFSIVAARCSAAEAESLRQIRDEKLYLNHAKDWDEFCTKFLHMSRASANRLIGWLIEFGAQYFEIAQLTRISPETYRAIAPSIQDGALHTEGGPIALIPENAEKVAAAVAELRKTKQKPVPKPPDPIAALLERCDDLFATIDAILDSGESSRELRETLYDASIRLSDVVRDLPPRAA